VLYAEPSDPSRQHIDQQLIKLHNAIGGSIMLHQYPTSPLALPTKKDRFSWTMGPDTRELATSTGADYALFVHLQDSYASAGRVAVQVVMGVLFGFVPPGGTQVGYATLVELKTGEVVWFNRVLRASGDLRKPEPARETIDLLLSKFPT
jgi:hypothetical protein